MRFLATPQTSGHSFSVWSLAPNRRDFLSQELKIKMENDKSKCKNFPFLNPPPRSLGEVGGGGGRAVF